MDLIGAVIIQDLCSKGPLGQIAWVGPVLWDLITFMFAASTRRSNSNCPCEEKLEPRFTVKGVANIEKWLNRKTFSIILELIYTVSFYLLSNREHKASCLKIVFFPKTISNFYRLVASVIGIGTLRSEDGDLNENCHKNNRVNNQNNNFVRASRFFVHFFAVTARLRRENT